MSTECEVPAYEYGRKIRFQLTFKTRNESTGELEATDPTTITFSVKIASAAATPYVYGTDPEVVHPVGQTGVYYIDVWLTTGNVDWVLEFKGEGACEFTKQRKFKVKANLLA